MRDMRTLAGLVIAAGIIGAVVLHKQRESAGQQASALKPSPVTATGAPAPAPTGQASQHNWPKRALDRAADVKRQVGEQRKADETR